VHKAMCRLGEYLITEFENGQLQWESHIALGMQRSGKCFVLDNILIIGHCREEDHGYLKLEFQDQLRKLPPWTKTAYYCRSINLLDVITGQVVTEDFLHDITTLAQIKGVSAISGTDMKQGAFKLGKYHINVAADGNISWQCIADLNKIIGGPCRIESNVLFICPQSYVQEYQNKQEFLVKLRLLPQWNNTIAWCKGMVLDECQRQQEALKYEAVACGEDIRYKFIRGRNPSRNYEEQCWDETGKRVLSSGLKQLSTLWHRILRGKDMFKHLFPVALRVIVLLLGLTMIFYSVGKGCHVSHWDDHHHHKHDHEED
jgi:hypothetical protein